MFKHKRPADGELARAGDLPYRGPGVRPGRDGAPLPAGRPAHVPLPPHDRLPRSRGRRPLKRWRYVGVYDERLMLCAGDARVGPGRQTWWAVWDREAQRLYEHTASLRHGGVVLGPGRVVVRGHDVEFELTLDERDGVETVCADGAQYAWTRKQGGIAASGIVTLAGEQIALDARASIDDSAGYHRRETSWWWSAGVGEAADGRAVAWNLVQGINDPLARSERSVWVGEDVSEPGPVQFAADLSTVTGGGVDLRFAAESERAREENMLIVRSRYRQPFGTFAGELGPGLTLARGYGVMERHEAWW